MKGKQGVFFWPHSCVLTKDLAQQNRLKDDICTAIAEAA